jgi:hypothetical protein
MPCHDQEDEPIISYLTEQLDRKVEQVSRLDEFYDQKGRKISLRSFDYKVLVNELTIMEIE